MRGNTLKYTGGESVTAQERYGSGQSMGVLTVAS
jgi:hypothetical protein